LIACFNKAIELWLPEVDQEEHSAFNKSGGILSRDTNGNNTKFKANILQAVQVDVKALANLAKITPTNDRQMIVKAQAAVMLDVALDSKKLPRNWISQRYIQHKTGRLYSDGVSLQNCCKEVRHSALNGLYSFDIDNCHYSILAQLTKTPTPGTNSYLANKQRIRNEIANELALPVDDVKQILISLIYGASLSPFKKGNAIADICGTEAQYNKVLACGLIVGLYKELKIAGRELIDRYTVLKGKHSGKVKNAMGLICDERTSSKKLSHILQGYEVKALEVVTSITKTDTAALLHDGWVTYSNHNKAMFEAAIKKRLGLTLTIDFNSIECSFEAPCKNATATINKGTQTSEHTKPCKLIDRGVNLLSLYLLNNYKSHLTKPSEPYLNLLNVNNTCGHKILGQIKTIRCFDTKV
jgi:hypothetical protein